MMRATAAPVKLKDQRLMMLSRTVENLLRRPDDEEAILLAELGRTGFGLELVLESPHDALFHQATLPERIYLDANVLMPSITPGHPHYKLFANTVKALQESATRAALNVSVCVYEGFLNEVVSHRRLAIDAMSQNQGEGALWAEREFNMLGSANVNVFIGAYFNAKLVDAGLEFFAFLQSVAPYTSEVELKRFLEKSGIQVLRESDVRTRGMPEILHAMEKFFGAQIEARRKSAVVIRHDAFQLAVLNRDLVENRRSIFVSADQLLRVALDRGGLSYLNSAMISHLGLAQLVELLVGEYGEPRGLASLLWMSTVSSETERIRNYLINMALAEHDAALAMEMTDVVDALAEDVKSELARRGLRFELDALTKRPEFNKTVEQFERRFFEKMRSEIAKKERG